MILGISNSNFRLYFFQQSILFHFRGIIALSVSNLFDRPFQFVFRQPLHLLSGLLVQSTTVEILSDRVHAAGVNRLDGMIVCKLSLLSALEISKL